MTESYTCAVCGERFQEYDMMDYLDGWWCAWCDDKYMLIDGKLYDIERHDFVPLEESQK